jgi:putative redox protein
VKALAQVRWAGEGLVFDGGAPGGPETRVDGDSKAAPSPVTMLLVSLGACTAADVVDIAKKMRIAIREVEVSVDAERADEHPRRVTRAHIGLRIAGGAEGDAGRLQHALDLSQEKYCSVLHSLKSDIPVTASLTHEPD